MEGNIRDEGMETLVLEPDLDSPRARPKAENVVGVGEIKPVEGGREEHREDAPPDEEYPLYNELHLELTLIRPRDVLDVGVGGVKI